MESEAVGAIVAFVILREELEASMTDGKGEENEAAKGKETLID